jgi:hypothetical protein
VPLFLLLLLAFCPLSIPLFLTFHSCPVLSFVALLPGRVLGSRTVVVWVLNPVVVVVRRKEAAGKQM